MCQHESFHQHLLTLENASCMDVFVHSSLNSIQPSLRKSERYRLFVVRDTRLPAPNRCLADMCDQGGESETNTTVDLFSPCANGKQVLNFVVYFLLVYLPILITLGLHSVWQRIDVLKQRLHMAVIRQKEPIICRLWGLVKRKVITNRFKILKCVTF